LTFKLRIQKACVLSYKTSVGSVRPGDLPGEWQKGTPITHITRPTHGTSGLVPNVGVGRRSERVVLVVVVGQTQAPIAAGYGRFER